MFGIDKIIDSSRKWSKEKEKRRYLEFIRYHQDLADDLKRAKLTEPAEICRQRAKNAQENLNLLQK